MLRTILRRTYTTTTPQQQSIRTPFLAGVAGGVVGAGVVGVFTYNYYLKPVLKPVQKIQNNINKIPEFITDQLPNPLKQIVKTEEFQNLVNEIQNKLENDGFNEKTIKEIGETLKQYWNENLGNSAMEQITKMTDKLPDSVKNNAKEAIETLKTLKDKHSDKANEIYADVTKSLTNALTKSKGVVNLETATEVVSILQKAAKDVKEISADVVDSVKSELPTKITSLGALFGSAPALQKMITNAFPTSLVKHWNPDQVSEVLGSIEEKAKEWTSKGFSKETMKEAENFITKQIGSLGEGPKEISQFLKKLPDVENLPSSVRDAAEKGLSFMRENLDNDKVNEYTKVVKDVSDKVTEWMGDEKGWTKSRIQEAEQLIKEKMEELQKIGGKAKKMAEEKGQEAKDKVVEKGKEIKGKAEDKGKDLKDKGKDLKDKAEQKGKDLKEKVDEKTEKAKSKGEELKDKAETKGKELKNKGNDVKTDAVAKASELASDLHSKGVISTLQSLMGDKDVVDNLPSSLKKSLQFVHPKMTPENLKVIEAEMSDLISEIASAAQKGDWKKTNWEELEKKFAKKAEEVKKKLK